MVTDDGSCNTWQYSRALDQAQIDTIVAWAEGGALELPETPALVGGTPFVTPEFFPEPRGGIFAEFDEYRCSLIDPQLDQDMFITGYEVAPGNAALVHHVLGVPVDPTLEVEPGVTNLDVITALDEAPPDRLGWPCFGVAGDGVVPEGIPVTWAPGQGVVDFPAGSGSRMKAGDLFVVQVHCNMVNTELIGESDSATVNLRLAPEVAREGVFDVPDGLIERRPCSRATRTRSRRARTTRASPGASPRSGTRTGSAATPSSCGASSRTCTSAGPR